MQNVRVLIDGKEVYSGKIDENAKIDIQKKEKYTKENPKHMTFQKLIDALRRAGWSQADFEDELQAKAFSFYADGDTLHMYIIKVPNTIMEAGLD